MPSLQGLRVLIVENDELNAMLLQLQLEGEDMQVAGVAPSVAVALQMLDALQPQLVFLDYWLAHGETSCPVAEQLRRLGIPFLVATGMDVNLLPEVFDAGIKLAKPYTCSELASALKQASALA